MNVNGQPRAMQNTQYDGGFYREIDQIFLGQQPRQIGIAAQVEYNSGLFSTAMEDLSRPSPIARGNNKFIALREKRLKRKQRTQGFCNICQKRFASIAQHNLTHTVREKKYKCLPCDKAFYSKQGWEFHMEKHHEDKTHQCTKCGKAFHFKASLNHHRTRKHDEQTSLCPVCGKTFSSRAGFRNHKKIHTAERKYRCESCGMSFAWLSILKDHRLIHTGEKPHTCSICGKSYRQGNGLRSHIQTIHEGKRRFVCEKCGYKTNYQAGMTRHMRQHGIGLKFLPCSICHKMFGYNCTLRVHMATHTKKHKCDLCGRRFSRPNLLRNHIAKYAGLKPFKCGHCGKLFHKRADSKHHVIMRHVLGEEELIKDEASMKLPVPKIKIEIIPQEAEHMQSADEEGSLLNCLPQVIGEEISVDEVLEARQEISKNWDSNLLKILNVQAVPSLTTNNEVPKHSDFVEPHIPPVQVRVTKEAETIHHGYSWGCDSHQSEDFSVPNTAPKNSHGDNNDSNLLTARSDNEQRDDGGQDDEHTPETLKILPFLNPRASKFPISDATSKIEIDLTTQTGNSVNCDTFSKRIGFAAVSNSLEQQASPSVEKNYNHRPVSVGISLAMPKSNYEGGSSYHQQESKLGTQDHCMIVPAQQPSLQREIPVLSTVADDNSKPSACILNQAMDTLYCDVAGSSKKKNKCSYQVCETCGKSVKNMSQHMMIHTENENLPCEVCGKTYRNSRCLDVHMKLHMDKMPHGCSECPKKFLTKTQLNDHMCTHTGARPHVCDECGRSFIKKLSLAQHLRIHANFRPFICKFCGKGFTQKCILVDHLRIHTGERPYVCDICGAAFKQSSARRSHRFRHAAEKAIKCDKCDYVTARKNDLKKHYHVHANINDRKTFKCDTCDKSFTAKSTLNRHLAMHNRAYSCAQCGLKFRTKKKFEDHEKRLANAPVITCGVCERIFHGKTSLERHMALHTGSRPKPDFICEICNHNFHSEFRLNNHVQRYAGMKPIVCGHCGKKFHNRELAKKHVASHVTEKNS